MKFFALAAVLMCTTVARSEEFPISYWFGPPEKFTTLERYQEIKDANFTFVMPQSSGGGKEFNLKLLDLCQQVGLKAIIMDGRMATSIGANADIKKNLDGIVADYSKHPALMGYYICDEPGGGAFGGLGEVVAHLKEKDPKHISFINLLPNYAPEWALATKTYKEHVENFITKTKPPFVSYDHYHFTSGGDGPRFFEQLETTREVTLRHDLPFWNIVLCVQHGSYRNLTEPELRFEAMQTLAYGGKGLLWFTYWSPQGLDKSFEWKHAMIDENGNRDPHYEMIKAINKDVQALGSQLIKCKSKSVETTSADQVTVGTFEGSEGKSLALYANRNYKSPVKIAAPMKNVEAFDPASRTWTKRESIDAELPPGGAALFRW